MIARLAFIRHGDARIVAFTLVCARFFVASLVVVVGDAEKRACNLEEARRARAAIDVFCEAQNVRLTVNKRDAVSLRHDTQKSENGRKLPLGTRLISSPTLWHRRQPYSW